MTSSPLDAGVQRAAGPDDDEDENHDRGPVGVRARGRIALRSILKRLNSYTPSESPPLTL